MNNPRITRPTPSALWEHEWSHRGRLDIHGHRRLQVSARFSSNEDAADGKPNEIIVEHTHGESRSQETIRMPRAAVEELIAMLNAALEWDGK